MRVTSALLLLAVIAFPASAREPLRVGADSVVAATAPPTACVPLLVETGDLGFGATAVFTAIPSAAEVHDLTYLENVTHLLVQPPAWPDGYATLQPLEQVPLPEGADLMVVLRGYPPTRAAADAWRLLRRPVRIVLIVDGPPEDRDMIQTLNAMRGLERVIADVRHPSRTGFERLQRPLSFRVFVR